MNRIKRSHVYFLAYIIITLLITGVWFMHSGYIFLTDFAIGPNLPLDWKDNELFLQLAFRFFDYFLPLAFVEKVFFSAVFLLLLFAGKKVAEQIISDPFAIFVVSVFAVFNPMIYDRALYGQMGFIASFGFLLFAVGFFLEYHKKGKTRQIIWAAILLGLSMQLALQFAFFGLIFALLFFAASLIFRIKKKSFAKEALTVLMHGALMLAVVLALNVHWFGPQVVGGQGTINEFIEDGVTRQDFFVFRTAGKGSREVVQNVLALSGFWGKDQFRYADLTDLPIFGISFLLLLPLLAWGAVTAIRAKETRSLAIGLVVAGAISAFLTVGISTGATETVTWWLFENFSPYKGFRETQKWVVVLSVVYLVFLSFGVKELWRWGRVAKNKYTFGALIFGIIVWQAPLLLFGFAGQVTVADYPDDWYQTERYLVDDINCDGNALFLPWHLYIRLNFAGAIVNNPAPVFFTCPMFSGTNMEAGAIFDNSKNPDSALIQEWVLTKGQTDFVKKNPLGIRTIILAKESDWHNYLWLEDQEGVELVEEKDGLFIYEIERGR